MTGFDELERQLLDSVARRGQRRPAGRGRAAVRRRAPRRGRVVGGGVVGGRVMRVLAPGIATAVAVAVVVLALTSLRHHAAHPGRADASPPHHLTGPPGQRYARVASRDYSAAMAAAGKRDRACASSEGTTTDAAPDPSLVSVLGVLGGPPSRSVPLPPELRRGWLQSARQDLFSPLADGIYVRYVRLARVVDGMYFYITAAAEIPPPGPPARCYSAALTILRARTRTLPRAERNAILAIAQRISKFSQRSSRRDPSRPAICFSAIDRYPLGSRCGAWAGLIEHHGIAGDGDPTRGVVPNGVASVTLEYRTRGGQTNTYNGNVINNVFAIHVAGRDARIDPDTMIWRSPNGKVIKTIPEKGCCSF